MIIAKEALREEFQDPEARHDYAEIFLNSSIALQIKALRLQRGWSRQMLAERAGMKQSRISAMEQASYTGWSLRTLQRLAQAFDLALEVRFEGFGTMLNDAASVSRTALERPSFGDDPAFKSEETVLGPRRTSGGSGRKT
ncbi:MAG TPA: helix-turn-helix transcriptional regulator [Thermoanaerobaculia bacterium]|nr:helix-turn-helix transcriptional regulator [Thermoanaerobaculia bacterium]